MSCGDDTPAAEVIGFDPGFGNTKICHGGRVQVIASSVSVPRQVGLAAIGLRAAGRGALIVRIAGVEYAVGQEAAARGPLKTSMDFQSLASPERSALLFGALAMGLGSTGRHSIPNALLVIGLPVPLLTDREQARAVMEALKRLKGEHNFQIGSQAYQVTINRIKVLAQPAGAYIDFAYDDQLQLRPGMNRSEVLVLDIGMNTLDVYVMKNGQVVESFIGGAEAGVRRLLERLTGNGHDVMELDADLRSGLLKVEPADLEDYLGQVLAALKRLAPNLKRFDHVIPCGGGAMVLGERLRYALGAKGAALHWPEDPVTANVRGFYKFGLKNG